MAGRQPIYTRELADRVLEFIASGGNTRDLHKQSGMPCRNTVWTWQRDDIDGFRARYADAREMWGSCQAEIALEIADNASGDIIETDRGPAPNHVSVARAKLRVETRRWMAEHYAPRLFGNKQTNILTGADGGPIKAEVSMIDALTALSAELKNKERGDGYDG